MTMDNLRVLAGGAAFTVVSDDAAVVDAARAAGMPTLQWTADLAVPEGTNVVLALCHRMGTNAIREQFKQARVLALPIRSFDESPAAAIYTLAMVCATDFVATCRRNNEWISLLHDLTTEELRFNGPNSDLRCQLGDNLRVDTSLDVELGEGEWVSIGNYCEVSLTPPSTADWHGSFVLDGHVEAVGVLVATDSRATATALDRIRRASELRSAIVETGPIRLELSDSRLRSAMLDGTECADWIAAATNPDYGLHATELGLGTNLDIAPLVDWTINSQLNEGTGLVHLGFGEGITGAHMDFIVTDLSLVR
jgi:hypothetical protein